MTAVRLLARTTSGEPGDVLALSPPEALRLVDERLAELPEAATARATCSAALEAIEADAARQRAAARAELDDRLERASAAASVEAQRAPAELPRESRDRCLGVTREAVSIAASVNDKPRLVARDVAIVGDLAPAAARGLVVHPEAHRAEVAGLRAALEAHAVYVARLAAIEVERESQARAAVERRDLAAREAARALRAEVERW